MWVDAIILFALLLIYMLDGNIDARHFHRVDRQNDCKVMDVHNLFLVRRAAIIAGAAYAASCWWIFLIPAILCFPWFHDGAYYHERNRLNIDVYDNGWLSNPSFTGKNNISFSRGWRAVFFVAGLLTFFTIHLIR